MLKAEQRLSRQKDFDRVFSQGRFFSEGTLSLKMVRGPYAVSRFGFIVSKKVSKKAVVRNRLKRRLRESVRWADKTGRLVGGWDVVVMPKPVLGTAARGEIKPLVDKLLRKSGLLN